MHVNKRNEKIKQFFDDAFTKMFQIVGYETFDPAFINQPFWYTKHEWTTEQEELFKKWFIDEYKTRFRKSKRYATDECQWFVFNYGWKLSNYPEELV